ncbi:MAG: CoA transferase [Acidimicrobiia bacterium]|nr:CoA transferase [Acidimicrobiia bacterium]
MRGALGGVAVVDATTEMWASLAAAFLGDFGADVVRIEDLSRPRRDPDRDGRHPRGPIEAEAELCQRNKRSIALDLSDAGAMANATSLVEGADVVVTDLPTEVLGERGWLYDDLAAVNPGLVYVRGSGFGPRGPDRDLPALDELAAARTGVMPTLPQPGQPPVYTATGQMYTAAMLAFGAVLALHERHRSGTGQQVDASLFGGNLYAASLMADAYLAMRDDRLSQPVSRFDAGNPMSGGGLSYPTSDGRWITLTMPDSDRWWPAFSDLMGIDTDDPRFDTHDKRCGDGRRELMAILEDKFSAETGTYWREKFAEHRLSADVMEKYDYPAGDEQARLNRFVIGLDHPSYGEFQTLGFPLHLSRTPARLRTLAPCRDQHNDEVLAEVAAKTPRTTPEATAADASAKALDGIRVLDLTVWLQGPVCAQHLADFGAEVIHVERPERGDQARGVRSINAIPIADWNQYFLVVNRNKKSMAIDLKNPAGRDLVYKMVEQSDVFLWNQGLGSLAGLGLDYETLSSINPRLVYATNSGYGHLGTERPAFDMTVQALTGIMTRQSEPGQPPVYLGLGAGDVYGGLLSALGIMLALHDRERTGKGQYVDASLYGAQLFLAAPSLQPFLATGDRFYAEQQSRRSARNPLWNRYAAADRWIFVCLENTDADWAVLCAAIGADDLAADGRFATVDARACGDGALVDALDSHLQTRPAAERVAALRAAGIACAQINDFRDVADDEQAWANDYFAKAHCSEVNREVTFRGLPITMSRTPGRIETLGPELGQDTELLLLDAFGCSWDEISELKAAGAIP